MISSHYIYPEEEADPPEVADLTTHLKIRHREAEEEVRSFSMQMVPVLEVRFLTYPAHSVWGLLIRKPRSMSRE